MNVNSKNEPKMVPFETPSFHNLSFSWTIVTTSWSTKCGKLEGNSNKELTENSLDGDFSNSYFQHYQCSIDNFDEDDRFYLSATTRYSFLLDIVSLLNYI